MDFKTFKDLIFTDQSGKKGKIQCKIKFNNGYGASIVKGHLHFGDNDLYEVAVLGQDGQIIYNTPITNNTLMDLNEDDVSEILVKIQKL